MLGAATGGRGIWLTVGLVAGLAISYVWPHEPVLAYGTDRDAQFAMCVCPVGGLAGISDSIDGIFTLDFLTGDLRGAVLNRQVNKFTAFYFRNVARDFDIDPKKEPHYSIISGMATIAGQGGISFASGVLYVGELTSGKVHCYAFPWKETPRPVPVIPLVPVDAYQFRQAAEKE